MNLRSPKIFDLPLQQKEKSHATNIRGNDHWIHHNHDAPRWRICGGPNSCECANIIFGPVKPTRYDHDSFTSRGIKYFSCVPLRVANTTGDGHEESHYTITPALLVIDRGSVGARNCLFLKRKAGLKCFIGPERVGRDRSEEFSGHSTPGYSGRNNSKFPITEFRFPGH
jgi:hypothetical protein